MESRRFADRRMSVPKNRKFLAVGNQAQSRFQGDEEIEMVYLKCDEATRPSLTCDGVVCIPEPNWVLPPSLHSTAARLVNLDDRLAIADICMMKPGWNLEIWIMDAQEETWSMTYSITLAHRFIPMHRRVIEEWSTMFTPLAVSKEGSLFFYDTKKRLFKYEPETDFLCCLSSDICVISPFVENLVRLHTGCVPKTRPPGCRNGRSCLNLVPGSRISKQIKLQIPNILLTSTLVSLICFGYSCTCRYCT
ncbi:unnamed protein product [Brassica napus]|uniref:(rape) hypothetical protein n=1 Tax=Brassica napus TaxID=3708 RepID=A0A816M3M3_BRANA|nr:unnamed protein product [Brassica napus]